MLTGLDLYKMWDLYEPFEDFQVVCTKTLEHYQTPYDRSSIIRYDVGQRYTCYRVGAQEIYFKTGDFRDGRNDSVMWDCFIKFFDVPHLTREEKLNKILI